jgi:undecaprenyl diphosphate synthase
VIGDRSRFAAELQMLMRRAEQMTRDNDRLHLTIAANYGGRWDIADGVKRLLVDAREGRIAVDQFDEEMMAQYLSIGALPPPDLCIRTGGDHRISNFVLWDLAYTELYFTDCLWPDFGAEQLDQAVAWFTGRQRRFGKTPGQVAAGTKRLRHA